MPARFEFDIGDIIKTVMAIKEFQRKRQLEALGPQIGTYQQYGEQGVAQTFGQEDLGKVLGMFGKKTLPTQTRQVPQYPSVGGEGYEVPASPTGVQEYTPTQTPQYRPQTPSQQMAWAEGQMLSNPETRNIVLKHKYGLELSPAEKEKLNLEINKTISMKLFENVLTTERQKEVAGYKEGLKQPTHLFPTREAAETEMKKMTPPKGHVYTPHLMSGGWGITPVSEPQTGEKPVTQTQKAAIKAKIDTRAQSMARDLMAARGLGQIVVTPSGVTMQWRDAVKGPKEFEKEYVRQYNLLVDEYTEMNIEIPKIKERIGGRVEPEADKEKILKNLESIGMPSSQPTPFTPKPEERVKGGKKKPLTKLMAEEILMRVGGDKEKARELAKQEGYDF